MAKISYSNKVLGGTGTTGEFTTNDANEIKASVNALYDLVEFPFFTSANTLSTYNGPSKFAFLSFTYTGKPYTFLMQRVTSARAVNALSLVNHSVSGDIWMRVGGTPIVFIEDFGPAGATSFSNAFLAGYELEEIKMQTTSLDLRLSNKTSKTANSDTVNFNQTIQGKILIEIS